MSEQNDKISISREELEEIVNQKVEEKLRERQTEEKIEETENISRRGFLKKLGLGAAGVGAMSLVPAAADININHDGNLNLKDTDLKAINSNIDLKGNNIKNAKTVQLDTYQNESQLPSNPPPPPGTLAFVKNYGSNDEEKVVVFKQGSN